MASKTSELGLAEQEAGKHRQSREGEGHRAVANEEFLAASTSTSQF